MNLTLIQFFCIYGQVYAIFMGYKIWPREIKTCEAEMQLEIFNAETFCFSFSDIYRLPLGGLENYFYGLFQTIYRYIKSLQY